MAEEYPRSTAEPGGAEKPSGATDSQVPDAQALEAPDLSALNLDKLNLIKDVEIPVSVEIGRTELAVRQILDLEKGSIVILEKESEEPMDIRVNGKLLARGEIVVVKDNFGIRITEIIDDEGVFG